MAVSWSNDPILARQYAIKVSKQMCSSWAVLPEVDSNIAIPFTKHQFCNQYALISFLDHIMTTPEKTYTEKQIAFLKPLLDEAKADIRSAMTIAGYA